MPLALFNPKASRPLGTAGRPLAFQILIDSKPAREDRFSPALRLNMQSFRLTYPGYRHHLFEQDEIRSILSRHFGREVLSAYDALQPFAYRADLARYCLLYRFGGLYSDLSYLHVQRVELGQDNDMVIFRDVPHPNVSHALSNALILARPGHPLLEAAIRQILAHHRTGFIGVDSLETTGPNMLGKLHLNLRDDGAICLGISQLINRDTRGRMNIVKLMPGGELVALRNKGNTSLEELLKGGGNSYGQMWKAGNVWANLAQVPPPGTPDPLTAPRRRSLRNRFMDWAFRHLQ